MKYALGATLLNIDGSQIKGADGKPVTFRNVAVACLVQAQDASAEDKYECFRLAVKIETSPPDIELQAEDVARLKRLIGAAMPVVIVGRMFEMLDQK